MDLIPDSKGTLFETFVGIFLPVLLLRLNSTFRLRLAVTKIDTVYSGGH